MILKQLLISLNIFKKFSDTKRYKYSRKELSAYFNRTPHSISSNRTTYSISRLDIIYSHHQTTLLLEKIRDNNLSLVGSKKDILYKMDRVDFCEVLVLKEYGSILDKISTSLNVFKKFSDTKRYKYSRKELAEHFNISLKSISSNRTSCDIGQYDIMYSHHQTTLLLEKIIENSTTLSGQKKEIIKALENLDFSEIIIIK